MKYIYHVIWIVLLGMLFTSCNSKKRIAYMYDLKDSQTYATPITNEIDIKIQKDDLLSIVVTSMHEESNKLFNSGITSGSEGKVNNDEYVVNKDGAIYLPVIGRVEIEGLTKEEAQEKIKLSLGKYIKDPIVNVRFKNFKYTIIGVGANTNNVFESKTEKVNIFEALAKAGDIKLTGEIHNVMLIRDENGSRNVVRLDLRSKDVLNSPYYYLRQNDIIYVEPKRFNDNQSQRTFQNFMYGVSAFSTLSSVLLTYLTVQQLLNK